VLILSTDYDFVKCFKGDKERELKANERQPKNKEETKCMYLKMDG
jgi:hypothetical protein